MKKLKDLTLQEFLTELSLKKPAPGGGSAAALTAALGAGLISMVANYSKGRSNKKSVNQRITKIYQQSERLRKRLLQLVDLDAQAYMGVVKARKASFSKKRAALKKAREVPKEVCQKCYQAVKLTPYLVENGNPYLLSDVEVAVQLLQAAYNAAMVNVEINQ